MSNTPEHPQRVGPYRILQPPGEGGMGIVYEAEQSEPVRRRVALKVVKPGMDTRENAVQHAHQKGIIHRDLKPSNILVTEHDGRPVPRIIDFGIAKATGARLTDRTVVTTLGQAMGTAACMSPEQAEMSGQDVDTRTDVYSLGVILYQLLVGWLPVDPAVVGYQAFLLRLASRETDPPTPSTRFSTGHQDQAGIARFRRTEPRALQRELKGDLDWIVMKAMDPDRTRRYDTVNDLARDLERYLGDEPVLQGRVLTMLGRT